MARNILRTSFTQPLKAARYLGDYEAIVVDLRWDSIAGINVAAPGETKQVPDGLAEATSAMLEQRSSELARFLHGGGVLVAKVQPSATMWERGSNYNSPTIEVDSTYWLVSKVRSLDYVVSRLGVSALLPGPGRQIDVREVGHPLEAVIREASGYTGIIAKEVFEFEDSVLLLATTRIGDPVAAEIPVGDGLVFLVPSGVDEKTLIVALEEILATRERHRSIWLLPEEAALIAEEEALRVDTREGLKALGVRQQAIGDLRAWVMKNNLNVSRAIGYYESGTSATVPVQRAMQDLHKLVDLLEGYFGGSEEALAARLSVPKAHFKHIKKLANQPKLDFRHATSGETEGADVVEVEQARQDARALVQRCIEVCCEEEVKSRSQVKAN
jgi:hypothetical protein